MALEVETQQKVGDGRPLAGRLAVPGANDRLVVEQVDRAFDEGRPGHAVADDREGFLQRGRQIANAANPFHHFHVRRCDRPLVDVLQRAAPLQRGRGGAAEQHERRLGEPGVFQRGQSIGDAGPRRHRSDARRAGEPRHGVGGEHGGRLIAHVDDAQAARLGADENGRNMPAA